MNQSEALIEQLCQRFEKKPRKCFKINDSNIGSAERIVCISNKTFYYYPKIQQFQDLDFDKLQYVIPKAGVKLIDIDLLKFPPRKENERNYFSIILPKNKILKITKALKEIIVDQEAEGDQEWKFFFDYDIVILPQKQKKIKQSKLKEIQMDKHRKIQIAKLKEKYERQKEEKISEEINSLTQAEELKSLEQNEQYLRKKNQLMERQNKNLRINESDELFFHYLYRQIHVGMPEKNILELELALLEKIGNFKIRAENAVREFIDELAYNQVKLKYNFYYTASNLKIKFGDKNLNQQFLSNYEASMALYELRDKFDGQLRIPLIAFIKYKGFKVFVRAVTPVDSYDEKEFDDAICHGNCKDSWKVHFLIGDYLSDLIEHIKLKPYFSEVHYQKVQIHLGPSLKAIETPNNPFNSIKQLDSNTFLQNQNYQIIYILDIDEAFPIDLDLENNVNQANLRLRPQYIRVFTADNRDKISQLSAGSLCYSNDDEEGEKEDLNVAKAAQFFKFQYIVKFVQKLDDLKQVPSDSESLSKIFKQNGVNMRYLSKVIKITKLPYIKVMSEVEAVARCIRSIYRDHQKQFYQQFRRDQNIQNLIREAYNLKTILSMRKIRLKQLKVEEEKVSQRNAIDFLNLVFGIGEEFEPFWNIIKQKVASVYEFQMRNPMDYPHGYLLKTVLYHCGFHIKITQKLKMFHSNHPFSRDDEVSFNCRIKTLDYPIMQVHKLARIEPEMIEKQRIVNRLELQLQIKKALRQNEANVVVQLSKYISKIGPPSDKYTIESFFYMLYHPTPDNFQLAHKVGLTIFPPSHPFILELYLQYSKLKDLDEITLKKAAENHATRNLGLTHWKTSEILSNFKETEHISHLIKAQNGVEESKRSGLYLSIVIELTKAGKLTECENYVAKSIKYFDKRSNLLTKEQHNYYQILIKGIENFYLTRKIEDLLKLSELLYYALEKHSSTAKDGPWYEKLLFYSLKAFLESHKKKYYLYKLILIMNEKKQKRVISLEQKKDILEDFKIKWRDSRNHINYIKELLIKLEFGYTEINFLPDFFNQFANHLIRMKSEDFNEGLKQLNDLFFIFDFQYFEDALLDKIYSFEKSEKRQILESKNHSPNK